MTSREQTFKPSVLIQVFFFIVVVPFLPLLISWQWDWWEAWVYAVISILGFVVSRMLVAMRHPDLLAERARMLHHEDAEAWDKVLSPMVGLGGSLIPLVAGLNARLAWSTLFNLPIQIIALVFILLGYGLGSYALMENRFFSGMVRIQTDRGHEVVSGGPYRWIRHPGYAGAILTYLATPIFLNTPWAFIPAVFIIIVLIMRTNMEDSTLQAKLEGYKDYAQLVHYRLVPGVW